VGQTAEEPRGLIVRRAGDRGLLVELDPSISPAALHAGATAVGKLPQVVRCTPGHSSLLLILRGDLAGDAIAAALRDAKQIDTPVAIHEIRVSVSDRDAPDLRLLLDHAGISHAEFLQQLSALTFTARHLGFRPGFAYLDGVPAAWRLPRRATPRSAVPGGSFAIAGPMAAFYPDRSPGGWNLMGRTDAVLWDARREPPNLIFPGDEVRVVAVE
jgi:KipI family sensor histidine kinase inhibitor